MLTTATPSNVNLIRTAAATGLSAVGINAIIDLVNSVRGIQSQLPDLRGAAKFARTQFEKSHASRMVNNKGRKAGVTGDRNASRAVVDISRTGTTPSAQRSTTGSRAISISQGGKKQKIPKSIYTDNIKMCFRAEVPVINNAANLHSLALPIGIDTGATNLATYMTQLTAMQALFREFRCLKLVVDFVPQVGSTTNGVIAVAIDRDPRSTAQANTSPLIRNVPFFEVDIKQPGNLTWTPMDIEDRRFRYTRQAGRVVEFQSHGNLLSTSNNDQAIAVQVGRMFVDGWWEFQVPN